MNSTSPSSSAVRMPTRSFGFSSVGPDDRAQRAAEFARDQVRQRRLAEAGRPGEQHVLERFAAPLRGVDRDAQVLDDLLLADVVFERARAQRRAVDLIFERRIGADDRAPSPRRRAAPRSFRADDLLAHVARRSRACRAFAVALAVDLREQRFGVVDLRRALRAFRRSSLRLRRACTRAAAAPRAPRSRNPASAALGRGRAPARPGSARSVATLPCSFATMSRAFCWPMPGSVLRNA